MIPLKINGEEPYWIREEYQPPVFMFLMPTWMVSLT
jgi:hypothetical protein